MAEEADAATVAPAEEKERRRTDVKVLLLENMVGDVRRADIAFLGGQNSARIPAIKLQCFEKAHFFYRHMPAFDKTKYPPSKITNNLFCIWPQRSIFVQGLSETPRKPALYNSPESMYSGSLIRILKTFIFKYRTV